ncbi:hypothetical protein ACLB2K_057935 [Fragaria x ananassa]
MTSVTIDENVVEQILSILSPKSLMRCKSVSKRWYALISSPSSIKFILVIGDLDMIHTSTYTKFFIIGFSSLEEESGRAHIFEIPSPLKAAVYTLDPRPKRTPKKQQGKTSPKAPSLNDVVSPVSFHVTFPAAKKTEKSKSAIIEMGVHGLWELLAPVGRRVSVETLAGRRLAIDASIWMVQFMKAMRDEKGEMVGNAHLLGFFRRICKLLYLRTKPVFVFDGGTPALKRRTVIGRRRQRENSQAKLRKTAEKLLLNHLKSMRLKELAEDIKNQRQEVSEKAGVSGSSDLEVNDAALKRCNQERLDEMLAASIVAEEEGGLTNSLPSTSGAVPCEEDDEEEDEELILPEMHGDVDPAVLAALPPSMRNIQNLQ